MVMDGEGGVGERVLLWTCAGTVGRSPDGRSYPTEVTTFSLLFGLTSSGFIPRPEQHEDLCTSKTTSFNKHIECRTPGHPLTLQTVVQVDDLVTEHGNENGTSQWMERVPIVWFVLIHSHCHWFPLPLESSHGKGVEMDPPVEGWAPGLPPRGLVISKIPLSSKIILFHQLSILMVLILGSKYY